VGGGIYNLASTVDVHRTRIANNCASTSHDDVFGDLTNIDDLSQVT
jgi:hypothetical protein